METIPISLSYLETLSTSDLLSLADEYGLDIPQHLNRRFIISELIEISEELNEDFKDDMEALDSVEVKPSSELPETYNETKIDAVLRNPVWAYVYWDISNADIQATIMQRGFTKFILKVYFWSKDNSEKPCDSCELSVANSDRAQYILLPVNQNSFTIDLIAEYTNLEPKKLATSRKILFPENSPEITIKSIEKKLSPIMALSGMKQLVKSIYDSHRQSFS